MRRPANGKDSQNWLFRPQKDGEPRSSFFLSDVNCLPLRHSEYGSSRVIKGDNIIERNPSLDVVDGSKHITSAGREDADVFLDFA
jgi:hypothetical protein